MFRPPQRSRLGNVVCSAVRSRQSEGERAWWVTGVKPLSLNAAAAWRRPRRSDPRVARHRDRELSFRRNGWSRPPAIATPVVDAKLAKVVARLVDAYRPERVYLFGSHARGTACPDIDDDLMLVVSDHAPSELQ